MEFPHVNWHKGGGIKDNELSLYSYGVGYVIMLVDYHTRAANSLQDLPQAYRLTQFSPLSHIVSFTTNHRVFANVYYSKLKLRMST